MEPRVSLVTLGVTDLVRACAFCGYSGVFADPDGHPWEIAHNPHWTIEADGSTRLRALTETLQRGARLPGIERRGLALMLVAATLAGCAGSDEEAVSTTAPTTTAPATTAQSFEGAAETVTAPARIAETALLERVAVAAHDDYDRVVFQFRNGLPGYRVEYVEPPLREDGSGNLVRLDGNAFVVVRMEPASGFDLSVPEGELVYTGPRRIAGDGTAVLRELVRTGDFEAVLTWAIGLDGRVPFRVLTLENPARIVVDFKS